MVNKTCLYPYSRKDAAKRNELEAWHESRDANISCRKAIEAVIDQAFDGRRLAPGCAESVIGEYGYKRVQFVLANTVEYRKHEDAFSPEKLSWAKPIYVPEDSLPEISAANPLPALEAFITQYNEAYQALALFDQTHCEADTSELDFTGRVLVLSPHILKESCWHQEDQLWYAHDGFGCRPHARGRSIRSTCLGDGETTIWNRHDFIGVLKDELLPEWAKECLTELTGQRQASPGMTLEM